MGRPLAPWRNEAAKECVFCGQTYFPKPKETLHDWGRRQTCSQVCASAQGGVTRRRSIGYPQLNDKAWLAAAYVDQKRSTPDIAAELGCNPGSVATALTRNGIPMRSQSEERRKHHNIVMTKEWLTLHYAEAGRSAADIADEVGCSTNTVINTLHRFGIEVRDVRAAHLRSMNEKRRRPTKARKLSAAQKRQVKQLNNRCAWCSKTDDLEIHHRDGDRANDDLSNLVVLCHFCHAGIEWFIAPVEQRLRSKGGAPE